MWIHAGEPASVVRSHERETFRGREPQRLRLRVFGHRLEQRVLAPTSERMTREVVGDRSPQGRDVAIVVYLPLFDD